MKKLVNTLIVLLIILAGLIISMLVMIYKFQELINTKF